jgi:hypothetical protein
MSINKPEISENNDDDSAIVCSMIKKYCEKKKEMSVKNISIDIDIDGQIFKLIRLDDDQYYALHKNSISIFDDYAHLFYLSKDNDNIYSSYSKMYVTLKSLFGEHGDYYDDWKGSFSFPFLIYFQKGEGEIGYLMNINNVRSLIEFNIAKLIQEDDERFERGILHKPFEEFPRQQINYFINYIVGFLSGYFESGLRDQYDEYFYKTVRSNLILFGYINGNFIDEAYETEEEFDAAIQELIRNGSSTVLSASE